MSTTNPARTDERKKFEHWYACNAFDYVRNPVGSGECGLQWAAWQAALVEPAAEIARLRALIEAHNAGAPESAGSAARICEEQAARFTDDRARYVAHECASAIRQRLRDGLIDMTPAVPAQEGRP